MTVRGLQAVLLGTAFAALVVMLGLFSTAIRVICLAAIVSGAWATEPERSRRSGGWWTLVAAGAGLTTIGFVVAEISDPARTAAGIAAIAGSAMVVVGATIGFPLRAADRR